jgi:hypothetical protein
MNLNDEESLKMLDDDKSEDFNFEFVAKKSFKIPKTHFRNIY